MLTNKLSDSGKNTRLGQRYFQHTEIGDAEFLGTVALNLGGDILNRLKK